MPSSPTQGPHAFRPIGFLDAKPEPSNPGLVVWGYDAIEGPRPRPARIAPTDDTFWPSASTPSLVVWGHEAVERPKPGPARVPPSLHEFPPALLESWAPLPAERAPGRTGPRPSQDALPQNLGAWAPLPTEDRGRGGRRNPFADVDPVEVAPPEPPPPVPVQPVQPAPAPGGGGGGSSAGVLIDPFYEFLAEEDDTGLDEAEDWADADVPMFPVVPWDPKPPPPKKLYRQVAPFVAAKKEDTGIVHAKPRNPPPPLPLLILPKKPWWTDPQKLARLAQLFQWARWLWRD